MLNFVYCVTNVLRLETEGTNFIAGLMRVFNKSEMRVDAMNENHKINKTYFDLAFCKKISQTALRHTKVKLKADFHLNERTTEQWGKVKLPLLFPVS